MASLSMNHQRATVQARVGGKRLTLAFGRISRGQAETVRGHERIV